MPSSRTRRAAARKAAADRRRRIIVAVVALAAIGGGGAAVATRLRSSPPDARDEAAPLPKELKGGSEPLARSGLVEVRDEPAAYRLVYRVETFAGGGDATVTRDEVSVRRPFEARTTKRSGPAGDDAVRSEQVAALGRIYVPKAPSSDAVLLETGPSIAPSDLRIAPVLEELIGAGRVEPREWRRVGSRPCQVLRFGGPISSGTVAPVLDPDVEYADACVSEQGLVLEEVWVEDGRVQRRRLATVVETGVDAVAPTSFTVDALEPLPVDEGGGSFRALEPASAYAAPFWVLDEAPLEEHLGRWAVVAPSGSDPKDEEAKERRLGSVADVWRSGIDVVVVEQGSTAGGVEPFPPATGPNVSVDGLGDGEVVLDLRTSELRFRRPDGYFLRVFGTVGAARLEEIARSLRETPGGAGLEYIDGE